MAPMSAQATPSNDGAESRKRKGAGGGRKEKTKIIYKSNFRCVSLI